MQPAGLAKNREVIFHTGTGLLGMGPAVPEDSELINAGKKRTSTAQSASFFIMLTVSRWTFAYWVRCRLQAMVISPDVSFETVQQLAVPPLGNGRIKNTESKSTGN